MRWLVLSDLHLTFKNCTTSTARKALIQTLENEREEYGDFSFILITGDCMNRHVPNLEGNIKFIKEIAMACGVSVEKIFMCAGNHDVDRNNTVRNAEIEKIRKSGQLNSIGDLKEGYGDFTSLTLGVNGRIYKHFQMHEVEDARLIIVDSTLLSKDEKDIGNLGVCFQELYDLGERINNDDKINIVIMHHSVNWLMPHDSNEFQHWLAQHNVKIVFCGHNHAVGLDILTEGIEQLKSPEKGVKQFTCGAALYDQGVKPCFYVGQVDHKKKFKLKLYVYKDNSNWEVGEGVLRSFPQGVYRCIFKTNDEESSICLENSMNAQKLEDKTYNTIFDADSQMAEDLRNSTTMDFFGMRGGTFLKESSKIADVLYGDKRNVKCRILVSYPYCDMIEKRLRMVPEFSSREALEKRWKEIFEDIERLEGNIKELQNGSIRFHQELLSWRFIITDNSLYLGYYEEKLSSQSEMIRYQAGTKEYASYKRHFENLWQGSKLSYEKKVPQKYSFLLGRFNMMPSLVVNLTDRCNMDCRYCPEGGENLEECVKLCHVSKIKILMTCFMEYCNKQGWDEKKVIRITGGEPLLDEVGLKEILAHSVRQKYQKVVLCTNGLLLYQAYTNNTRVWEEAKEILLLKISLDSLKNDVFNLLTRTNNNYLEKVKENIKFAREKGFKIELNFVATKDNVHEIEQVYEFASQNRLLGVKVLTINDFGERVEQEDVSEELRGLVNTMRSKGYVELDLYVHNNKGILMKRFMNNGCMLTIVDHMNKSHSVTPRRTYSEACENCEYYPESSGVKSGKKKPCATGIMSLTMRADGALSFCRLQVQSEDTIANLHSKRQIAKIVNEQMEKFQACYHYDSKLV